MQSGIQLFIEKEYEQSKWCQETLSGLKETASRHKMTLAVHYSHGNVEREVFSPDEIILILGTSQSWFINLLSALHSCACRILLISNAPIDFNGNISRVIFKRKDVMLEAMKYIASTGHYRCALFGYNPSSPSDTMRVQTFFHNCASFGMNGGEESLYLNKGSIEDCFTLIKPKLTQYNAVICANDPVAVYFMNRALEMGYTIPKDLYVLGFGNSILSEKIAPSLSSIRLDYYEIGTQAIDACLYLQKHPAISSMDVYIPCEIVARLSTGFEKNRNTNDSNRDPYPADNDLFFNDPAINEFFTLEHFYEQCDEIDLDIIKGLRKKTRYESLAGQLHISEYTLKYRLKKIFASTKTKDRTSFCALLERYKIADNP